MQMQPLRLRAIAFVAGVAMLAFSGWASADPPSRVARLGYTTGAVSFSPAGEIDWVRAAINRPLTNGDRLWADARARAEVQVGGAMIRMSDHTGVSILNLDDRIAQLQLTQGTLNIRVRRLDPNQVFEIDTPNLAFTVRRPGEYRIEVDPDGNATTIDVRRGMGEAYGEGAAYVIDSRQPYRFTGTGLREYEYLEAPRLDEFDRWASDRDRRFDNSASARYVSQDVVGYEDLDANGSWRTDATYGNIWFPNRVAAGWAPYRDGHWAWIDPWGWTWVDDAPWGYAVSHYGRWTNLGGSWGWVPGPVRTRAYYAPALVAFVGGDNFQLTISSGNVGGVAWFPLAPREIYRPSYVVSRGYFENINRSNTVINNTVINNYYNNSNVTNIVYANRQVPGAIVAVPATAFVQSQPVARAAVQVSREMMVSAPVAVVPRMAPTERSVRGAAAQGDKPPGRAFERPVVARSAPPAAVAGFAAQQQQLTAQPGKPLDEAVRRELRPVASAPAPVVKMVGAAQVAPPTALPPPVAPVGRSGDGRGRTEDRKAPGPPAVSNAPVAAPQATPPVPAVQTPEQRGQFEQRGRGEPRGQPVPPPAPPQRATPAVTPQVAPPAPTAPPPEQRGVSEQRGNREQRGQPAAPPPAAAQPPEQRGKFDQRAKEEQRAQPAAPPPAAAQPPEQRGKFDQRAKEEQRAQPVAPPPSPPRAAPPPQFVPPASQAPQPPQPPQRAKPETAPPPATTQGEARAPVAAPKAVPAQPQPVPRSEPRGPDPRPAAGKPDEKKKDKDERKRENEDGKQKD